MELLFNLLKFIIYSTLIIIIAKNALVTVIRKLATALNLDSKIVGNIAGIATSMPELISVFFTSIQGMFTTVIFNVLSSNIINVIQYMFAIILNKNQKKLQNEALISDIVMVIITILIPLCAVIYKIELNIGFVPIFIMLFILFYIINKNSHKMYLEEVSTEEIEKIENKSKRRIATKSIIYLIIIGISLFTIGELLGGVVSDFSRIFNIPEAIIGIAMGFVTSIPELITFIESQKNKERKEENIDGVIEATNNLLTSNNINLFIVLTIGILVCKLVGV